MVRQFVELHQGTITVDSTVGKGTTVLIWLPREHAPAVPAPETLPAEIAA
jgi:signal transduction histidine kinase